MNKWIILRPWQAMATKVWPLAVPIAITVGFWVWMLNKRHGKQE